MDRGCARDGGPKHPLVEVLCDQLLIALNIDDRDLIDVLPFSLAIKPPSDGNRHHRDPAPYAAEEVEAVRSLLVVRGSRILPGVALLIIFMSGPRDEHDEEDREQERPEFFRKADQRRERVPVWHTFKDRNFNAVLQPVLLRRTADR